MKVKVVKNFKDKHTGQSHKVGDVFVVNKKRFEEILSVGPFVEEFSDKESKEESKEV